MKTVLTFLLFVCLSPKAICQYYGRCSFCHKGFNSYATGMAHLCAVHNYGCTYTPPVQTGPSPEELKRMREEKDSKEASEYANDNGVECYKKKDWNCAIKYFKEALDYNPDNDDAVYNLKKANQKYTEERDEAIRKMLVEESAEKIKNEEINKARIRENFLQEVKKDIISYSLQLQKLISEIKVRPPKVPRRIHEGIMLGLFNTDEKNAITDTSKHVVSSHTGKNYKASEIFATSDLISAKELARGVMDNSYLGEYTLNTAFGKKLIERIEGTQFDRLIAHSNGATVSEALIRKGIIKVDELNIIGGDRSLINYFGLNELIVTGKVKRIVVWINPGDIIPIGSSAGLMSPMPGARDQYITAASSYFSTILTGNNKGGDSKVEYRYLKGVQYEGQDLKFGKDVFDAHGLEIYQRNIQQYFKGNQKNN